ncbi:hypothetical protein AKJ37_05730 [candidate division MSBL1 archaeon SCGC-AAA259I09]|uniref:Uncharacterized protein n=4 Tax=candidate division MSBL1 TaxID=215777 RepID=A0A133UPU0_9EURY|nr:hypothetical protein AKJ61_01435 [candidate division MSBL1 archaeon SCGC-AAA259B11]KXA90338.1 hypothetical protein AKJ62_01035 [candidate division MSBL1 archaeon SCGC-AAA259D14]KXA95156.1 hypothetical protein AKJ36_01370 [candidate division MSBL1 archaeon SCGC-AAA259I07]KXA96238.1 hypothetical protein AKJ37_05730 [candidate division MSBL1 archaeon SCGC-AAA259I09]
MGEFDFPLLVSRERYVTKFGGCTTLLEKNRIGLHSEALLSNTNLSAGDRVIINPIQRNRKSRKTSTQPLFKRTVYRIKPITELHDSRLLAMSSDGEAILSSENETEIEFGEEIVINAAINRLPKNWTNKIIQKHIEDRFSMDSEN